METTTGMSAPPIEATKCQPNARAITVMINTGKMFSGSLKNATINKAETMSAAKFNLWRCGNIKALELIFPLNLPNATTEPVKVTAPMKIPKNTSTLCTLASAACSAKNFACSTSFKPFGMVGISCKP